MANVVIIGGGTAGMAVARALGGKLGHKHQITLVEQNPEVYFQPALLWVMVGRRQIKQITKQVNCIRIPGARVVCSQAIYVDTDKKNVRLKDGGVLPYDQVIIAAGADSSQADTEELARAGYNLYTPEGVLGINRAISNFKSGKILIMATAWPFKCTCSILETAFLLDEWFRKKGNREAVEISVYTPEVAPLQMQGNQAIRFISRKLQDHQIQLSTGARFLQVDPARQEVHFASGTVPYNLLIYVPRHTAPYAIAQTGLIDQSGWIPVDAWTMETQLENVYAIGDITRIPLPSGLDLPKLGALGHLQALVLAENIQSKMEHKPPTRFFGGKVLGLVEIGTTAFSLVGDFYQSNPQFKVLPESRFWLLGKWFIERVWLREHS